LVKRPVTHLIVCVTILIGSTWMPFACRADDIEKQRIDFQQDWDAATPLANPHKGWYHHYLDNGLRKYLIEDDAELLEFPGMDHLYLRLAWSYLEPREGEFNWDVVDRLIDKWVPRGYGISFRISCRETGTSPVEQQYATPRWVIDAGAKGGHYYKGEERDETGPWEPVYDDPIYMEKLENFLRAFAARYDGKPWLRYVDIGSIGDWGEGHTSSGSGKDYGLAPRKAHVDLHLKYFEKSTLCITDDFVFCVKDLDDRQKLHRHVVDSGIIYRDDSILVDYYLRAFRQTHAIRSPHFFEDTWLNRPSVLELQHYGSTKRTGNWDSRPGSSMAEFWPGKKGPDLMLEAVETLHATYIGYHGYAREWLADNPKLTEELLNRCGYWYFLYEARLAASIQPGAETKIEMTWENRGVAPAYHGFRLKLRLEGKQKVDFDLDANNRRWVPNEPGKTYSESYSITLPEDIEPGDYTLTFMLYCPTAKRDVAAALNKDRRNEDGFYRIGTIKVER